MVVETLYVTINRDELRELREESAEFSRLRATHSEDGREVPDAVTMPTTSGTSRPSSESAEFSRLRATHSEDGREVPEVVGIVTASGMRHGVNSVVRRPALHDLRPGAELMTVSQHERILAAKDAELKKVKADRSACWAEFKVMTRSCLDAEREREQLRTELEQMRAQPASQVGGGDLQAKAPEFIERARRIAKLNREAADELEEHDADEAAACDHMADINTEAADPLEALARAALAPAAVVRNREADRQRLSDPAFNQWLDEVISDAGHTVWDQIPDVYCAWHGWENRQHYAPSAVVMPEQQEYHQIAFEIGGTEDGAYHFEADELDAFVARLNRRALPAGLLNKLLVHVEARERQYDEIYTEGDELRALLNKDEK